MLWVFNNSKVSSRKKGDPYDGEKRPGDLRDWKVLSADSNYILESTYGELTRRSSTLYHTYAPAAAAVEKQTQYAIGPGLIFRSQPQAGILGMDAQSAKDWGKDFQKIVHFYFQKLGFYEKQQTLFRTALTIGDALIFPIREGGKLDLVEAGGDVIDWMRKDSNTTLGIKHDRFMRPLGIQKEDGEYVPFHSGGELSCLQFFDKKLSQQMRGYPLIYKVINLAKNDDRHWDAITQRAVMESIILGTQRSDGTDFTRQNRNFAPFKDWMTTYIGMATDTPPEVIASKYSTSYTAHRGALNDFRKSYVQKRTRFQRTVVNPI